MPPKLRPENLATKRENGVTVFSSRSSFLSNLYSEAKIQIDGQFYDSTEQYYQHQKATFFNDDKIASEIMSESDPYKIMRLGYQIKGFNEFTWSPNIHTTLYKANLAKFTQVQAARDALLATGHDNIGEATKNAKFGIGFSLQEPEALDPGQWTGENLFGRILQDVRATIRGETSMSAV